MQSRNTARLLSVEMDQRCLESSVTGYVYLFSSTESKMNMIHNAKMIEHIVEENCVIHQQATNTDALLVIQKGIHAVTFR